MRRARERRWMPMQEDQFGVCSLGWARAMPGVDGPCRCIWGPCATTTDACSRPLDRTGFDSIGDQTQGSALSAFLDGLDSRDQLFGTILYNLNPADNYLFATMIGNFQDGTIPGKVQLSSGWWFLDQKEGMEWQMNALSNLGLLSRFVGMVTDSRSFCPIPGMSISAGSFVTCWVRMSKARSPMIPNCWAP